MCHWPGMRDDRLRERILVVAHGRQRLEGRAQRVPSRSGGGLMTRSCVANAWQEDQRRPPPANGRQRIPAGQHHNANDDREQPLSVPCFPCTTEQAQAGAVGTKLGFQSAISPQKVRKSSWRAMSDHQLPMTIRNTFLQVRGTSGSRSATAITGQPTRASVHQLPLNVAKRQRSVGERPARLTWPAVEDDALKSRCRRPCSLPFSRPDLA